MHFPIARSLVLVVAIVFARGDAFSQTIDLWELDGMNGFRVTGLNGGDRSGSAIASGDINNDGIDDLVLGAPNVGFITEEKVGTTYVVFGSTLGFDAAFDLTTLDGTNGFAIWGITQNESSGRAVAVGDINGDTIDDVILGGTGGDGALLRGATYVIYGSSAAFAGFFPLTDIDGANGFVVTGLDPQDNSGAGFAIGDVNNDTIDDLLIGATGADPAGKLGAGEVYVVFGSQAGFGSEFDLGTLDGSNGFLLNGATASDAIGSRMTTGDINGDGIDDMVVSSTSASAGGFFGAGKVFTFFGSDTGFAASNSLATLDGTNGFVVEGAANNFIAGNSVAAGDINDDGIDDLVIGANINLPTDTTYVLFGRNTAWPATSVLTSASAVASSTIIGATVSGSVQQQLGSALAIGDLNNDTIDDLVIGAQGFNGRAFTYAIFGDMGFPASFNVASLDGANGFVMRGTGSGDGNATRVVTGDINGDDNDDVIIGAPLYDIDPNSTAGNDGGESYVVFSPDQGSVGVEEEMPGTVMLLLQNVPNPFRSTTSILFETPLAGHVRVEVFNVLGQRVAVLADGWKAAGRQSVAFRATGMPPGVYVYRLTSGDVVAARTMVVAR